MLLTILLDNDTKVLNVPEDSDCELLYQLSAAEFTKDVNSIQLAYNGKIFDKDNTKLSVLGISENDMVIITTKVEQRLSVRNLRSDLKPEQYIQLVKDHPYLQIQFDNVDPEMGALIKAEDIGKMRTLIMKRMMSQHKIGYEQKKEQQRLFSNPDNEENQKIIAEKIRMENVDENMHTAMENLPEAFGRVVMLYVDIEINGHPVKAFVDSGAQSTIMSENCAERCGILRLLDQRFAGEARGVGSAKILGRVHIAQMKVKNSFLPISITILQQNDVDFLWGLDMLKRYRCAIDLSENCLRVNDGGEVIPFLMEKDLPDGARGTQLAELQNTGYPLPAPAPPAAAAAPTSASSSSLAADRSSSGNTSVTDFTTANPGPDFTSSTEAAATTDPSFNDANPPPAPAIIASSGTGVATAATAAAATATLTEADKIQHLLGMGFPEQAVRVALAQAEGNVELAAQLLLAMTS